MSGKKRKARAAAAPAGSGKRRWLVPGVAAAVLLAVLGGGFLAAPVVWLFATDQGQIVVETDDPNVEAIASTQGVTIHDKSTGRKYTLKLGKQDVKAGTYEVEVSDQDNGLILSVKQFSITRGGKQVVKVSLKAVADSTKPPAGKPSPADSLRREDIPAKELAAAGGGDPQKAPPKLVAILGEHQDVDPKGTARSNEERVAISPDGRLLADVTRKGVLRVWDLAAGKLLQTREPTKVAGDNVRDMAFSPDGRLLAFARSGDGIVLWEIPAGKEVRTLPAATPICIAFHPDGQTLAFGPGRADLGVVKVLEVATGKELQTLSGHTAAIQALAFSPDGKVLASGARDGGKLWDWAAGRELHALTDTRGTVSSLAFSPEGKVLASGGTYMGRLWDPSAGKELRVLDKTRAPLSVCFHPSGQVVAGLGEKGRTVRFWDVASGTEFPSVMLAQPEDLGAAHLTYAPDGRHVAAAMKDGTVYILRLTPPPSGSK